MQLPPGGKFRNSFIFQKRPLNSCFTQYSLGSPTPTHSPLVHSNTTRLAVWTKVVVPSTTVPPEG